MRTETEAYIQQQCFIWYSNNYARHGKGIMFSVPNESIGSQQRKVNTGLLRGVSDTIIVLPNKVLFVEFKTEKGYQSEFQKDFQERVTKLGHEYYVIRNLEQFKKVLQL